MAEQPMNQDENTARRRMQMRLRTMSLAELKEQTMKTLENQLTDAEKKLCKTAEENETMKQYIEEMNKECIELQAQVFEEANRMVQDAMLNEFKAIEMVKEKIIENSLLRNEISPSKVSKSPMGTGVSLNVPSPMKGHKRSSSHQDIQKCPETTTPQLYASLIFLDSVLYKEFVDWLNVTEKLFSPALLLSLSSEEAREKLPAFLITIIQDDVLPCLKFHCIPTTQRILKALPHIDFSIHPLTQTISGNKSSSIHQCSLVLNKHCEYFISFQDGDSSTRVNISLFARNRIVAVCNLFLYLSLIDRGLVRANQEDLYRHIQNLRKIMALTRLGFDVGDQLSQTT